MKDKDIAVCLLRLFFSRSSAAVIPVAMVLVSETGTVTRDAGLVSAQVMDFFCRPVGQHPGMIAVTLQ